MNMCKERIQNLLQQNVDLTPEIISDLFPDAAQSVRKALHDVENPRKSLNKILELMKELVKKLEAIVKSNPQMVLYHEETIGMILERWQKLVNELYDPKYDIYDLTKVPDIHDNTRYDALLQIFEIF